MLTDTSVNFRKPSFVNGTLPSPSVAAVDYKKKFEEKNQILEKKNVVAYVTPRVPMGSLKQFQPIIKKINFL